MRAHSRLVRLSVCQSISQLMHQLWRHRHAETSYGFRMRTGCAEEFRARCQAAARAPRRERQRVVCGKSCGSSTIKSCSILGNARRVNFWYAILWARPVAGRRRGVHNWFLKDLGRKLEIGTIGERLSSVVFIKECGSRRAGEVDEASRA